jgi:peroxiredoxin
LGRLYPEFRANDCEVLVIIGDPIEKAKAYAEILHLPFAVLADPKRDVYHRFGLDKVYLFIQQTASVIVDREGRIQYIKRANSSLTWLEESHELVKVVQKLAKTV